MPYVVWLERHDGQFGDYKPVFSSITDAESWIKDAIKKGYFTHDGLEGIICYHMMSDINKFAIREI